MAGAGGVKGPAEGVEAELKLVFAPGAGRREVGAVLRRLRTLHRLGPFWLGPARRVVVRDLYWDTAGGELARAGLSLRLRRAGPRRLITLKTRGSQEGGYARRLEWEAPLDPGSLAQGLGWLRARGVDAGSCRLAAFATGRASGRLLPVLKVVSRRCRRGVVGGGRPVAELSLDFTAYPGREGGPVHGLEVELGAGGTPAHLQEIEALLAALAPGLLRPDPLTKLETGLARRPLWR